MESNFFIREMSMMQDSLYGGILKSTGRLGIFIVIPLDTVLDTAKIPLQAIQDLVLVVINLLGFLFSNDYTIKDALKNFESSLNLAVRTPIAIVIAIPKAVYQSLAIMIDPQTVERFGNRNTFYAQPGLILV